MSAFFLDDDTEPAPCTPEHQALRDSSPDDVELYDSWHVLHYATYDAEGRPLGVETVRAAAVSTADPVKVRAREEWLRSLRKRREQWQHGG